MNLVILVGNLGRDVEQKITTNGTSIATFSLATTEKIKGESKTEWHKCLCFGKISELAAQYLQKGSKVGIQGKIQTKKFEHEGVVKYSTEILVNYIEFLDSKGSSKTESGAGAGGIQDPPPPNDKEDDLPF